MDKEYFRKKHKNIEEKKIDKEKICPFLIRAFWSENNFHNLEQFSNKLSELEKQEISVYVWRDTTLREIIDIFKRNLSNNNEKKFYSKFKICTIFQDSQGIYKKKDIGTVYSEKKSSDDYLKIEDLNFKIGDFLDINIVVK